MRKRFLHDNYGANDIFWDKNWDKNWSDKYAGSPKVDKRLALYLEPYLKKNMVLLEGGCGDGQYVRYFAQKGCYVIGVDFAAKTVRKLNQLFPEFDIRQGDITSLNFPDNFFDAYYSGGVIEHFEEGLEKQLLEAKRVLKNGGYFFLTVPHMNLTRRVSALFKKECYKTDLDGRQSYHRENVSEFFREDAPDNFHFHEYVFSTFEVTTFLKKYDFHVIKMAAFSSDFGLLDIEIYRKLAGVDQKNRNILHKISAVPLKIMRMIDGNSWPVAEVFSRMVGVLFGNLKLYVCRIQK